MHGKPKTKLGYYQDAISREVSMGGVGDHFAIIAMCNLDKEEGDRNQHLPVLQRE